jgi:hypothetical protein
MRGKKSMANNEYDGIVEAVRLDENGKLIIARMYERKGFVYSDHFLIDRNHLIDRLKNGQRLLVGKRLYKMGSAFETGEALQINSQNGEELIAVGKSASIGDSLTGLPHF